MDAEERKLLRRAGWLMLAVAAVLAWALMAGCRGTESSPLDRVQRIDPAEFFAPPSLAGRLAAAIAVPDVFGLCRVVQPPTRCIYNGPVPVPLIETAGMRPVAGQPFTATWAIDWTLPPAPRLVSVLASTRPLATPVAIGADCWLMVHPDFLLVPDGNLLRYEPQDGALRLSLVPPPALAGSVFYLQCLVAVPGGNTIGHVVSPLLIVEVGSR
ncbi:MAG: hypothetical protein WAT39_03205 [Planctomycetota bacterium]